MTNRVEGLVPPNHWEKTWKNNPAQSLSFDPQKGDFSGIHKLLQKTLSGKRGLSFLEIGCYPGRFLWYFDRFFGCRVEGVELIDWCCDATRELLAREGTEAEVYCADFLHWEPPESRRWDIVGSFGFVEHFEDYRAVVARHAALVASGGWLVLEVPNHRGIYGFILRKMNPEMYSMHNRMSLEQLQNAVLAIPGLELVRAENCGSMSLSHVGFLERTKTIGGPVHFLAKAFKFLLEGIFGMLPRIKSLSPYSVVIARRK